MPMMKEKLSLLLSDVLFYLQRQLAIPICCWALSICFQIRFICHLLLVEFGVVKQHVREKGWMEIPLI